MLDEHRSFIKKVHEKYKEDFSVYNGEFFEARAEFNQMGISTLVNKMNKIKALYKSDNKKINLEHELLELANYAILEAIALDKFSNPDKEVVYEE